MYGLLGLLSTSGENSCQSTFRNIFTEKNGDVFNTYFTRCNYDLPKHDFLMLEIGFPYSKFASSVKGSCCY